VRGEAQDGGYLTPSRTTTKACSERLATSDLRRDLRRGPPELERDDLECALQVIERLLVSSAVLGRVESQDEGAARGIEHVHVRSRDPHLLTVGRKDFPESIRVGRHAEQRSMRIDHGIPSPRDPTMPRRVAGDRIEAATLETERSEDPLGGIEI